MSPKVSTRGDQVTVREDILEAANNRFQTYGYGKTTMAEIASDCGMSASNLYRYFENKQDIGAALATSCLGQQLDTLTGVVAQGKLSAADKLEKFILALLHHTHHHWQSLPRMTELVDDICNQRREIVIDHMENKKALLIDILKDGLGSGEFRQFDLGTTADAILTATIVFDVPHFMNFHSLEEFETKARNLARLLVSGLANH